MRILLIQTPNVVGTLLNLPGKELPLSLLYLAAAARRSGHDVAVLDLDFLGGIDPHLENALTRLRPELVGLSAYTTNVARAGEIARRIKAQAPATHVTLGGFHASALPERTLAEFADFDSLVVGEGETTLVELAEALASGADGSAVPGVVSRNGRGAARPLATDLDDLPWPARDLLPLRDYVPDPGSYYRLPTSSILYSRGCPFHCTFCSKAVFKDAIRYRRPEAVVEEMRGCARDFGVTDFRFVDEGPTVDRRRMTALCDAILHDGLDIKWHTYSRVDTIGEAELRLMKRAGCYHVTYGVESGSERTLERIDKRLSLATAREIIGITKRLGLECKANFILGFPWETHEDVQQTIAFAFDVAPDLATFNVFKPLPGSRLYDELAAAGQLRHTKWEDYFATSEFLLFESQFTEREMKRLLKRTILRFHLRPRFVAQRLMRLARHPRRELQTLWRGAKIIARNLFR